MPRSSKHLLILNAGSSSLKFAVSENGRIKKRGKFEHLVDQSDVRRATEQILETVKHRFGRPRVVVHRIVHGGQEFWKPTQLTTQVLNKLARLSVLAPLHMPANLAVVKLVQQRWRNVEQWGVFDTGLYHNLPDHVRLYSIPLKLASRYGIRKYGFHGISHAAAWARGCQHLGLKPKTVSGVTVHLGSGSSVTAWNAGRPADTSMGFTPLEGLTMATRSGDLDPYIPLYLQLQLGWTVTRVSRLLEQQSGMYGITGLRDVRDVLAAAGHPIVGWPRHRWTVSQRSHARLALKMFIYDIQRYLASYLGRMAHPRLIVFTGAIGQNAWIRQEVIEDLPVTRGVRVLSVPTDEEAAIVAAVRFVVK